MQQTPSARVCHSDSDIAAAAVMHTARTAAFPITNFTADASTLSLCCDTPPVTSGRCSYCCW